MESISNQRENWSRDHCGDDDGNDDAYLTLDADGKIIINAVAGDQVVLNEAGQDVDLRVESQNQVQMMFLAHRKETHH